MVWSELESDWDNVAWVPSYVDHDNQVGEDCQWVQIRCRIELWTVHKELGRPKYRVSRMPRSNSGVLA